MREYTKALQKQAFRLIEFYRQNPVVAAYDLLGVELAPIQAFILENMWFKNYSVLVAGRGCGKAIHPDELVRVKDGWKRIKDIKEGDYVYGSDGKLAKVTMTSGLQKDLNFYEITLRDGRTIKCCEDHLWKVWSKNENKHNKGEPKYCVKSTKDLYSNYYYDRLDSKKGDGSRTKEFLYAIPVNEPILDDSDVELSIHPYIMGVILGDGGITTNTTIISSADDSIIDRVSIHLPDEFKIRHVKSSKHAYSIVNKYGVGEPFSSKYLAKYGLCGCKSEHKFIPSDYLFADYDSRLELLKGLLDTDGSVFGNRIEYSTSSSRLAADVADLTRSLGINCRVSKGKSTLNGERKIDRYRIAIYTDKSVFSLERKLAKCITHEKSKAGKSKYYKTFIVDIKPIGKSEGCCIAVDNDDHTYITKDYIVTHNSFLQAVNACLTVLLYPGKRVGLIGSSFRQAKTMFNEVDRIYQMSPILQQAAERKPINGTDMCLLKFKAAGRYSGTRIAAIPLGNDGGKIRGERFHVIAADEFAQIPEDIFNLVIKPMAATASDPMERAKRVARAKKLKAMGIEVEDDDIANKIIMSSSGYYKANHMWGRMKYYWSRIKAGDKRYAVMQIPYWLMPEGFLDSTNIEEARETLPSSLFEMEYCGLMVSDTDGFYKASLLEACTANSLDNFHTVAKQGHKDKEYIMAVDPARERDSFAILIFEVMGVNTRIVYAKTYTQVSSIKTAKAIFDLRDKFNLTRIIMDSQGGGSNIRDLLEEGIDNNRPILNIDDKNNFGREGDMILELFNPSPKTNTAANYTALSMLEHKRLWFPAPPQISDNELENIYDECVKLRQQIVSIVTVPLGGGYLKFMSSAPKGKKDLYSCFIMGCQKVQDLYKESFILEEAEPILEFGGYVHSLGGDATLDGYVKRERPLIVPGVRTYE